MEHWLECICEPSKLWLAWQPPDPDKRTRWAVGSLERGSEGAAIFQYLVPGAVFESLNQGRSYAELLTLGFAGYPAFSLKQREHRAGVLEALMRRLPPRSRADFGDYQRHFRIPGHANISDFSLLGLTEAKLPSDGFSVVDPLDGAVACCDLMLEVAGYRYYARDFDGEVSLDTPVTIVPEPQNKHDPNAIAVRLNGKTLGYINRLQTAAFSSWLARQRVDAWIERIIGRPDHPRLFIFVRVRPSLTRAA